jgi:hypothetical protein
LQRSPLLLLLSNLLGAVPQQRIGSLDRTGQRCHLVHPDHVGAGEDGAGNRRRRGEVLLQGVVALLAQKSLPRGAH